MDGTQGYQRVCGMLGMDAGRVLLKVPKEVQAQVTEIRMYAQRPAALVAPGKIWFLDMQGNLYSRPPAGAFSLDRESLKEIFVSLCGWAVHSHQSELSKGYISVRGGHRAGIAGTAVVEDGKVTAVREITSIALRIARQSPGASGRLIREVFPERLCGVLIAGAPASGKTTMLRDLAQQVAGGRAGGICRKVCIVDESGEIGSCFGGQGCSQLGCCDLLSGYPKMQGLEIALRFFSPEMIVCDEIYTKEECAAVEQAANGGVCVVTSVHAASFMELERREIYRRLVDTGAFEQVVLLQGAQSPCNISEIRRTGK